MLPKKKKKGNISGHYETNKIQPDCNIHVMTAERNSRNKQTAKKKENKKCNPWPDHFMLTGPNDSDFHSYSHFKIIFNLCTLMLCEWSWMDWHTGNIDVISFKPRTNTNIFLRRVDTNFDLCDIMTWITFNNIEYSKIESNFSRNDLTCLFYQNICESESRHKTIFCFPISFDISIIRGSKTTLAFREFIQIWISFEVESLFFFLNSWQTNDLKRSTNTTLFAMSE